MMDILRIARDSGTEMSKYEYIGMGGIKFYDFEMFHRYLGVKSMISLEQDKEVVPRCRFNSPFGFIAIRNQTAGDFIDGAKFSKPTIIWLDYDWGLSKEVTSDVFALGSKLPAGSFVFVTVSGELPGAVKQLRVDDRVAHFRDELGVLSMDCSKADVEVENYPLYVERVIGGSLSSAFSARQEGKFSPLMRVVYRDTIWMATVGGCFCSDADGDAMRKKLESEFPFLYKGGEIPYRLSDLNFTPKERALLDKVVTSEKDDEGTEQLKKLGLNKASVAAYKEVVRFLPRYVETFM